MWGNYFVTSLKWLLPFQPGETLFPTDENGKPIFDSVDLCRTWEVSLGRREPGEEPGEGEPPSSLPLVRMGCGPSHSAVHESKGCDARVVGEETIAEMFTERNGGGEFWPVRQTSISFHMTSPLRFFLRGDGNSSCIMTFFPFFLPYNQC